MSEEEGKQSLSRFGAGMVKQAKAVAPLETEVSQSWKESRIRTKTVLVAQNSNARAQVVDVQPAPMVGCLESKLHYWDSRKSLCSQPCNGRQRV